MKWNEVARDKKFDDLIDTRTNSPFLRNLRWPKKIEKDTLLTVINTVAQ